MPFIDLRLPAKAKAVRATGKSATNRREPHYGADCTGASSASRLTISSGVSTRWM
jgi:hypothetical protein